MSTQVYLLSGVATSADFMHPLSAALGERYLRAGSEAFFHFLHPYGTWERRLIDQLNEARQDISRKSIQAIASSRGKLLGESIMQSGRDHDIVLIGHSAGGIAAIHAASILKNNGFRISSIVQIGCPKHAVPVSFRDRTLYAYGVRAGHNKGSDPIVRIGTWGGWEKGTSGWPLWNSKLYAPCKISTFPLVGGHTDYFRSGHPYHNDHGISNLELTTDVIWNFINPIK
jgi:hypothetical protein